jgi:hypothetical protein
MDSRGYRWGQPNPREPLLQACRRLLVDCGYSTQWRRISLHEHRCQLWQRK